MRMQCPHCDEHAYTRTSLQLTRTSRETVFQCRNYECGHVFAAVTEINRTISPSAIPNPMVILPISRHVQRRLLARQLETAPEGEPLFSPPVVGTPTATSPWKDNV